MSTIWKWQPFTAAKIKEVETGTLIVIARQDGKSWSGIVHTSTGRSVTLRNSNSLVELHFDLNPTASFAVLDKPVWEIKFGQPRLI